MPLLFNDTIISPDPTKTPVARAQELTGHRTVKDFNELLSVSPFFLSPSYTGPAEDGLNPGNENNDAIGQLWYVIDEECFYQLVNWENRANAAGWEVFRTNGSAGSVNSSLPFAGNISVSDLVENEDGLIKKTKFLGKDWKITGIEGSTIGRHIAYKDDLYVMTCENPSPGIYYSYNIRDWKRTNVTRTCRGLCVCNGKFFVGSTVPKTGYNAAAIYSSINGKYFELIENSVHNDFARIIYLTSNGTDTIVGILDKNASSTDENIFIVSKDAGDTWQYIKLSDSIEGDTCKNGLVVKYIDSISCFVAGTGNGVYVSENGIQWVHAGLTNINISGLCEVDNEIFFCTYTEASPGIYKVLKDKLNYSSLITSGELQFSSITTPAIEGYGNDGWFAGIAYAKEVLVVVANSYPSYPLYSLDKGNTWKLDKRYHNGYYKDVISLNDMMLLMNAETSDQRFKGTVEFFTYDSGNIVTDTYVTDKLKDYYTKTQIHSGIMTQTIFGYDALNDVSKSNNAIYVGPGFSTNDGVKISSNGAHFEFPNKGGLIATNNTVVEKFEELTDNKAVFYENSSAGNDDIDITVNTDIVSTGSNRGDIKASVYTLGSLFDSSITTATNDVKINSITHKSVDANTVGKDGITINQSFSYATAPTTLPSGWQSYNDKDSQGPTTDLTWYNYTLNDGLYNAKDWKTSILEYDLSRNISSKIDTQQQKTTFTYVVKNVTNTQNLFYITSDNYSIAIGNSYNSNKYIAIGYTNNPIGVAAREYASFQSGTDWKDLTELATSPKLNSDSDYFDPMGVLTYTVIIENNTIRVNVTNATTGKTYNSGSISINNFKFNKIGFMNDGATGDSGIKSINTVILDVPIYVHVFENQSGNTWTHVGVSSEGVPLITQGNYTWNFDNLTVNKNNKILLAYNFLTDSDSINLSDMSGMKEMRFVMFNANTTNYPNQFGYIASNSTSFGIAYSNSIYAEFSLTYYKEIFNKRVYLNNDEKETVLTIDTDKSIDVEGPIISRQPGYSSNSLQNLYQVQTLSGTPAIVFSALNEELTYADNANANGLIVWHLRYSFGNNTLYKIIPYIPHISIWDYVNKKLVSADVQITALERETEDSSAYIELDILIDSNGNNISASTYYASISIPYQAIQK